VDKDGIGNVCDPCDDRDSDQDGIKNCLYQCPYDPETFNGYQDDDGCPDEKPKEGTIPPQIVSTPTISQVTQTSAVICWETDKPATVWLGMTIMLGNMSLW